MAVRSIKNKEYLDMYNEDTMTIIDDMPVIKLCRSYGLECERCSGPDIMPEIFQRGLLGNKTHYFYGGADNGVLVKLKESLNKNIRVLRWSRCIHRFFYPLTEEDKLVYDEINQKKPEFVWDGIGASKQELWIREHQEKIKQGVMLGVGTAFIFFRSS